MNLTKMPRMPDQTEYPLADLNRHSHGPAEQPDLRELHGPVAASASRQASDVETVSMVTESLQPKREDL